MGDSSGSSESEDEIPSPSQLTSEYLTYLQNRVQPLTRLAAQLPGPSDLSFHRSLDRTLLKNLDSAKEEIVSTLNTLLNCTSGKLDNNGKAKAEEWHLQANDLTDGASFSRRLGDVIDTLLERADVCLDEFQGKVKPSAPERPRTQKDKVDSIPAIGPLPSHLLNANILPLPQTRFKKKPDNSREVAWKHSLAEKPHAAVPLSWTAPPPGPNEPPRQTGTRQGMYSAEGDPRENPYYYEIQQYAPPGHASVIPKVDDLVAPPPLQKDEPTSGPIPFLWVNDEATFSKLYDHLDEERVKEIAIDVEHHNYRSYQGLVCLVQISTRWYDYIIDALSPLIRNLSHRLNNVFADPAKVKILHGAEHDILWLQRDLNIYIVGLFDTYHATNVLNFPQHSLAFLLSRYVGFEADKRYQLADWRIRPLEKEMMFYARSDTHSLMYIYDCLRFEISQKEGVEAVKKVFELSKRTASKTYAKEEWDDGGDTRDGWKMVWKKMGGIEAVGVDDRWAKGGVDGLSKTERIFRALHNWRDQIARLEDESPRYILPSNNLLNLSSRAPTTHEEVLPCVGPAFKKRSRDVAQLIAKETKILEEIQIRRADQERQMLQQKGQPNGGTDEEMGEIVSRGKISETPQSLWAEEEKTTSDANGKSAIASLLFSSDAAKPVAASKTPSSLFAPTPPSADKERVLKSIKTDLSAALRAILGQKSQPSSVTLTASESGIGGGSFEDGSSQPLAAPETVPFVSKADRAASAAVANNMASTVHSEDTKGEVAAEDDTIVKVKKDKKRKSMMSEADLASPGKEGKPRWTKEEKAQRKKEREAKAAEVEIEPFDYSNAKSILDVKASAPVKKDSKTKEREKEKKKKQQQQQERGEGGGKNAATAGRYASISVRRDRREQQGGKSVTFQK